MIILPSLRNLINQNVLNLYYIKCVCVIFSYLNPTTYNVDIISLHKYDKYVNDFLKDTDFSLPDCCIQFP